MTEPLSVEQMRSEFKAIRQSASKIEDWARKHVPKLLDRLEKAEAAMAANERQYGTELPWVDTTSHE